MFHPVRLLEAAALTALLQERRVVEFFTLPEPDPPRGVLSVIIESFAMVAALVGTTVVIGVGFGLFRMWLLRRHPDNRFNGRGKDVPRLDLN